MDRKAIEDRLETLILQVGAALAARQNREVMREWFAREADLLRQATTTEVDLSYVQARLAIIVADNGIPT